MVFKQTHVYGVAITLLAVLILILFFTNEAQNGVRSSDEAAPHKVHTIDMSDHESPPKQLHALANENAERLNRPRSDQSHQPSAEEENQHAGTEQQPVFTDPASDSHRDTDIDFKLELLLSSHHLIDGRARSRIGEVQFNSQLTPSNEVELTLTLKQTGQEDITLLAYIDIAHFTMELDGGNRVLNADHKIMLEHVSAHLRSSLGKQYEGLDFPEHGYMLVQMLSYWSVSPEGFIHEQRSIASQG